MFRNIIGTIGSKLLLALMSFLIVTITSNNLGPEGYGYISLIILGITMVQMVNNFVGGPALIYLIPRYNLFKLFVPSYLWAFISAISVTFILYLFDLIPRMFGIHIMCISFICSINSINQVVLLGKEKIKKYNHVTLIQQAFMLLSLAIFFLVLKQRNIEAYINSLYVQYIGGFVLGYLYIHKDISKPSDFNNAGMVKDIVKYGAITQTGNIIQLLNYRLSFYIIDSFAGKAVLGAYNVGVQLAEGLWLIGKSLALIQYTKISNVKDKHFAKDFSIQLLKINVISTLMLIIPVFLLPTSLFQFVFGDKFTQVKEVFIYLSPGIIAMAGSIIFSHYFSGLGKIHINTIASSIGLVFTFAAGFVLIPRIGLYGAAITASMSYVSIVTFQFILFLHMSKTKARELLINKKDKDMALQKAREIYHSLKKIR